MRRHKWRFPIQYFTDRSSLEPPSLLADYSIMDVDIHEESITLPEGKFDLRQVLPIMKRIDELFVERNSS